MNASYIGYPTRSTADIVVDFTGDLIDDPICIMKSPEYPDPIEISLDDAVNHIAKFGFDSNIIHALIVEFNGLCADTQRRTVRGHMTPPEGFGSIYDD